MSIPDDERRLEALKHLCYRTVPKLWPEVYSDQFRARRVFALEEERDKVIAELRDSERKYADLIDEEIKFYAAYTTLTETADDDLKQVVHRALEDVFELDVTDLDEGLADDEDKTLDLLVKHAGLGFIEVRSSGDRGAQVIWMERLDEHVETMKEERGPPDYKVFIFNGRYRREPNERTLRHLFNKPVVEEAIDRGVCLVATSELLGAIEAQREGTLTTDQLIEAFRTPGVFQAPSPK